MYYIKAQAKSVCVAQCPIRGNSGCIALPQITILISAQKWNAHIMFFFFSLALLTALLTLCWIEVSTENICSELQSALQSLGQFTVFLSNAHSGHLAGFSYCLYKALYHSSCSNMSVPTATFNYLCILSNLLFIFNTIKTKVTVRAS